MADISQIRLPSGDTFDLIDEKSGYITAQYIENKTDYSIPVSRVGEIVVGETAIGTESTNFPTSKAVVDYVDERVVQEIDAIDVGVTGIKANGTSLSINNGVVNIPVIGPSQSVGLMTEEYMTDIYDYINNVSDSIPTSTSQLDNDSGFITSETDPTVPAWAKASTKPTYTANEVGALPSDTVITDEKLKVNQTSDNGTYYPILTSNSTDAQTKLRYRGLDFVIASDGAHLKIGDNSASTLKMGKLSLTKSTYYTTIIPSNNGHSNIITLPNKTGTVALLDDIPTIPTNISAFTNDSGYLTSSDIASVMIYKGTKANYAALPASGNTTGDVWHLTDTGAEWAWDGSAWQELGTAIDLSNYLTTSDIAAWAKASTKPTYTAAEVGALPDTTTIPSKTSDLTNDSGFITSYTDEKLGLSLTSSPVTYYPILTLDTTTAGKKSYDNDGFKYYNYNGTTSDVGNAQLTLGNNKTATTAKNKRGTLELYGSTAYATRITAGAPTVIRNIEFPNKDGTVALTSDIPQVYSSTNTGGYLTMATLPIYDGTVE